MHPSGYEQFIQAWFTLHLEYREGIKSKLYKKICGRDYKNKDGLDFAELIVTL